MAELLWGQVYIHDKYVGVLRQEPGERCSFKYDASYLAENAPAISRTLPLRETPHISDRGLHPFFDNLVSEGWLEEAQTRLLGRRRASRFELLLAFGQDCAGAVSVHDPTPVSLNQTGIDMTDPRQVAVLTGRASLSGIQPKFTLIKTRGKFRPARSGETSTHIAKFPSPNHEDLIANEYLTMHALQSLLPDDPVAKVHIDSIEGSSEPVLIIKRFDRSANGKRLHFEEFNQVLGRKSAEKYDGSYREMADFIRNTPGCLPVEIYRLYVRVLAGLLLGNTDMHFKNFAMFHDQGGGLRLTPSYDQVAAALYGYKTIALAISGVADMSWSALKARSLVRLGREFSLSTEIIQMACDHIASRKDSALEAIAAQSIGTKTLRNNLLKMVKQRWNGTFSLIGKALSKKR